MNWNSKQKFYVDPNGRTNYVAGKIISKQFIIFYNNRFSLKYLTCTFTYINAIYAISNQPSSLKVKAPFHTDFRSYS
jgi:hypothetical protein